MAQNFNIVAKLSVQGPTNIRQIVRSIQGQLNSIKANVNITVANNLAARLNGLNTNLQRINTTLIAVAANAATANTAIASLANSLSNFRRLAAQINVAPKIQAAGNAAAGAAQSMEQFGEQAGLAIRRFAAFAVPTTIFLGLVTAIKEGLSESIEFEKEMVRLSQVTGRSISALSDLSGEITRLSTSLGTSSKDLGNVATTLAQAGLSAKDTKLALEALARSSLAATFTSIEDTTEGAIAVFRQFNVEAGDLQGVIGSLNSVSAQFAVESDDLVSVIRRTGGAFKASGGSLNELLGLFTSVRATTRESADSIATGFRTIFTRIQRPRTIQFLRELGVELQDAKGQFIGPVESIRKLNAALSEVPSTDPRFAAVIEELGGFRQVSKVIPLIQQFPEALKAISVAEQGQQSIVEDSIIAQKSLANEIVKVKEEFLALFRELTSDKSFQFFIRSVLELAKGLIEVARAVKPLIPLIGAIGLAQVGKSFGGLAGGFANSLTGRKKFARGGLVTGGSGVRDDVPAELMGGEYVISKHGVNSAGIDTLNRINSGQMMTAADGGRIPRFADGGKVGDDLQFVVAGLKPKGKGKNAIKHTEENYKAQYKDAYTDKTKYKTVDITTASISEPSRSKIEDIIKSKMYSAGFAGASFLKSQLQDKGPKIDGTKVESIMKKAGSDSIAGSLFEGMLALAGAPYDEKKTDKDPIDFLGGVGPLGELFGLKGKEAQYKADAKRTADSTDFKRRNLRSYLKNTYSVEPGKDATKNPLKSKKSSDSKYIIPTVKSKRTPENIKEAFDSLKPEQLATLRSNINNKKYTARAIEELTPGTGINYLSKEKIFEQLGLQNREDGGEIFGGSGQKDDVNALVMGGEYVISKEAAQKFGYNKLDAINEGKMMTAANGGKVQHFASGGRVRKYASGGRHRGGSFTSGGENIGFAVSGIASLATSFIKLDSSTQKLINSFTAVAATASVVSLGIRGLANESKARQLGKADLFVGATGRVEKRSPFSLPGTTAGLARNFDKVSGGVALASSALIVFGQHLQDSALIAAKSAKTQEQLDKAIEKDARGNIATGVGAGAGIGAAIGTVIAPGIGTAIGAGIGALTGGIVGVLTSNNKELVKGFNQGKFDATTEKLEQLFDDFSSNRITSSSAALSIGEQARTQLENVKKTSDIEQRGELTKQLKNNLVNYRTLSTSIIQNVKTLDEFENSYGRAGKTLIESIAYLTNKSYKEVRETINKEIEARQKSIETARLQAEANSVIKEFSVSVSTLTESLLGISDRFNGLQNSVDSIIALAEGTSLSSKFNAIPNDLFSRAASGGIQDTSRVSKSVRNLTASLDNNSINSIEQNAVGVTKLTNILPKLLADVANNVGLGGSVDGAELQFNAAINNLTEIPDNIKTIAKSIFGTELSSREASGESGFKKVAREDILGLADKLVPEAIKAAIQELDKVNQAAQGIISSIGDRLEKASRIQLAIAKQRIDVEDRVFELAKFRLKQGEEFSLEGVRKNVNDKRGILLEGTGLNAKTNPVVAGRRLLELQALRDKAQEDINTSGVGTEAQATALRNFANFNTQIQSVTSFLKDLSSSTQELTFLQDKLGKAEADRASGKSLLQKLLFGGPKGRVEFNQFAQDANNVATGKKNIEDLPQARIDAILSIIKELPQNQKSGLLGGKTPEEFLNEQTRQAAKRRGVLEGVPADQQRKFEGTAQELTTRTKREEEIRAEMIKVQREGILAERTLIGVNQSVANQLDILNTTTLSNFAQEFRNAISESQIAGLNVQKRFEEEKKSVAGDSLTAVSELSKILGVKEKDVQSVGKLIAANQSGIESIQNYRKLEKESKIALSDEAKTAVSIGSKTLGKKGFLTGHNLRPGSSVDVEQASQVSVDIAEKTGLGPAFRTALQARLKDVKFDFVLGLGSGKAVKHKDNNFSIEDEAGRIKAFATVIDEEIKKFRNSTLDDARVKAGEASVRFVKEVTPFKGSSDEAHDLLQKFLDPKILQDVVNKFTLANAPLEELQKNYSILSAAVANTTKSIEGFQKQIKPIDATVKPPLRFNTPIFNDPNFAVEKASGGIIGGKSINRPLTTFSPKGADKIPAILSKGEYVVNAAATAANRGLLDSINAPGFARGGYADIMKKRKDSYQANMKAKRDAYSASRNTNSKRVIDNVLARERNKEDYAISKLTEEQKFNAERGVGQLNAAQQAFRERDIAKQNIINNAAERNKKHGPSSGGKGLRGQAARDYFEAERQKSLARARSSSPENLKKVKEQGAAVVGSLVKGLLSFGSSGRDSDPGLESSYQAGRRRLAAMRNAPASSTEQPFDEAESRRIAKANGDFTSNRGVPQQQFKTDATGKLIAQKGLFDSFADTPRVNIPEEVLNKERESESDFTKRTGNLSVEERRVENSRRYGISEYQIQRNDIERKAAELKIQADMEDVKAANARGSTYALEQEYKRGRTRLGGMQKFAAGGPVPGSGNRDTVPALLTPGEFVLNRGAARAAGLGSLSNFNQRFNRGGQVQPATGGGMGPMYSLSPESLSALSSFTTTFDGTVKAFGGIINTFSSVGSELLLSMTSFSNSASQLANALSSFPKDVTHTHSPITVAVNISGVEGLESTLSDKILAAVDQKMSSQRTKSADGKSPFFSK